MGILATKHVRESQMSIVIDSMGSPYAFMQDDLSNSCARCRSPDRESWRVIKELERVKSPQDGLLSLLTKMGD